MANNAYVNVKNVFSDNVTVNVTCRLQDGTIDQDVDILQNETKQVQLASPEVTLVLKAPEGMDLRDCLLKVKTDVDVETIHSRTDSNWAFKIIPNTIPPDIPTTMNVTVGHDEPD